MHLELQNPKIFSDIIGVLSEIVTEVKLKLDKQGLYLNAIDPANVAMAYFKIPSDLFSEFIVEGEKTQILGVNLENLKAVLRRCKPGSSLILEKTQGHLKLTIKDRIKR